MKASMSIVLLLLAASYARAESKDATPPKAENAVERGKKALLGRSFTSSSWSLAAYENVWKLWEPKLEKRPENYDQAFREHYGMHAPPYENGKYPMGLRVGPSVFGGKAITVDCMMCHAGSILGKSYVGLGNATLDIQSLFEDLSKASGQSGKTPFAFGRVRGTSEAGGVAVFLLSYREPDLSVRFKRLELGHRDDMIEDTPAWWLLNKKTSMYHTGSTPASSVRSIMQFSLSPLNSRAFFEKEESTFTDIQAYLRSLKAPKYPFEIDDKLVAQGRILFNKTCARCHGTYGADASYPNKIVPVDVVGTDPHRYEDFGTKAGLHYNKTWFAQGERGGKVRMTKGYQAPPLDGVWATAPYLHNASVPTLQGVLHSKSRPAIFTRSYRTDEEAYDKINVGWKVRVLREGAAEDQSGFESRKIYDTREIGRGNEGHTFGDGFSETQRRAVIEYLKTL